MSSLFVNKLKTVDFFKVVPKDLKSQLALSKMGIVTEQPTVHRGPPIYLKPPDLDVAKPQPTTERPTFQFGHPLVAPLNNSAQSARSKSESHAPESARKKHLSNGGNGNGGVSKAKTGSSSSKAAPKQSGGSPGSSRSSSRSSSVSPRERSGSSSSANGRPHLAVRATPLSPLKPLVTSSPMPMSAAAKKKLLGPPSPLVPWSKRNNGVQKICHGWTWVGEPVEQKVYINVSRV
jgi:hypothetical protein